MPGTLTGDTHANKMKRHHTSTLSVPLYRAWHLLLGTFSFSLLLERTKKRLCQLIHGMLSLCFFLGLKKIKGENDFPAGSLKKSENLSQIFPVTCIKNFGLESGFVHKRRVISSLAIQNPPRAMTNVVKIPIARQ